jgi:hypothetical protein
LRSYSPSLPALERRERATGGFNYGGGTPATSADGDGGLVDLMQSVLGISGAQNVHFDGLVGVFVAALRSTLMGAREDLGTLHRLSDH